MSDAPTTQPNPAHRWGVLIASAVTVVLLVVFGGVSWIRTGIALREASAARNLLDDSRRLLDDSHQQIAEARRQVDDARRQLDELHGTTLAPKGQANGSDTVAKVAGPVVTVADLLVKADSLRAEGRLREAEIILTRAVQTDRDDVEAWRALAGVQRDMSTASISAGRLLTAAQEADRAQYC